METLERICKTIQECEGCVLSRTRTNAVCGSGPVPARLMLVAQAPGRHEDETGELFVGRTGGILDGLLAEAGIDRGELYVTNLLKCALPGCRRPKSREIEACTGHLEREIECVNPHTIVPMGYYSTRYLAVIHGLKGPRTRSDCTSFFGSLMVAGHRRIYPVTHPSVLIHQPGLRQPVLDQYRNLGVLARDCRYLGVCPLRGMEASGLIDDFWLQKYCRGDWKACRRFVMEEEGKPHTDSLMPDGSRL